MKSNKNWFASKTIVAAFVAMIMFLATHFGWDFDEGLITEAVVSITNFIAIIIVVYGRVVADKAIE